MTDHLLVKKDRTTIADLQIYGFSMRLINQLENHFGFLYVDDLADVTEGQLRSVPYFGIAALAELRAGLRNFVNGRVVNTVEDCVHDDEGSV